MSREIDYPLSARSFCRSGDLGKAGLLIVVLVNEFTNRDDITDVERAACRIAHGAVETAILNVWRRTFDAGKEAYGDGELGAAS